MLGRIDLVHKYLQTEHLSLSDCHFALEAIIEFASNEKNNEDSELYQYKLGNRYISGNFTFVTSKTFESGVVIIQRDQIQLRSSAEKCESNSRLVSQNTAVLVTEKSEEEGRGGSIMDGCARKDRKFDEETI